VNWATFFWASRVRTKDFVALKIIFCMMRFYIYKNFVVIMMINRKIFTIVPASSYRKINKKFN